MRSAQKRGSSSHGKEDAYSSDFDDESLPGHGQSNSRSKTGKDMNTSSHSMDISSSHGGMGSKHGAASLGTPRKVPGETKLIDEKKKAKADASRVYFTSIAATIIILLLLIIFSLEGLKTEEELRYSAYPKRLEEFGFRASQLKATVRQKFLDGTLNLTMLVTNEGKGEASLVSMRTEIDQVLDASLERCSNQWSDMKLLGKCHGLKSYTEYFSLQNTRVVPSSPSFCKALCCELGEKCTTWQYAIKSYPPPKPSIRECYLGGPVKITKADHIADGTTYDKNGAYCEALAPTKWRGKKLSTRAVNNETYAKPVRSTFGKEFKCEWGQDLSTFCEGLGEERTLLMYKNSSDKVGSIERLSRKQCAASCCSTIGCTHYQESPDKGCFHNDNTTNPSDIKCEDYLTQYTGGYKIRLRDPDIVSSAPPKNSSVIILDKSRAKKALRQAKLEK